MELQASAWCKRGGQCVLTRLKPGVPFDMSISHTRRAAGLAAAAADEWAGGGGVKPPPFALKGRSHISPGRNPGNVGESTPLRPEGAHY